MGQADALGLSKTAALKLARTKLNRVNGHTTLFTGTPNEPQSDTEGEDNEDEPDGTTSETVKSHSYYGDHTMGPAERSKFNEKTFPAAISFLVNEDTDCLSDSFTLTVFDINTPRFLLNQKEFVAFQADVQTRSETTAFTLGEQIPPVVTEAEKLYEPTHRELLIKVGLIVGAHPQVYLPLCEDKLPLLRDCLHVEFKWKITTESLKQMLLSSYRILSIGSIPVDSIGLATLDAKERQHEAATALPTRRSKEAKEPRAEKTEAEVKEIHAKQNAIRKRLAAPKPKLADRIIAAANFKQKQEAKAKITFHEDPRDRSYMRIRVTHMYKDKSRPTEQPSHKTDIDLTYRNTRPRGDRPNLDGDFYDPSTHMVINASDRSFIPTLDKLFPHLARNDPQYWNRCFASLEAGHSLVLLVFPQNDLPMTSNLFVDRDDIPTSYKDLQVVMRGAPLIFALVRGTDVEDLTASMMSRFVELAKNDPLSKVFVDPYNPFINDKGIKPTPDLPKFTTMYENSFEDWREYSIHCGVGGLIELRFGMQEHVHRGKASAHPVPHTQVKLDKDGVSTTLDLVMFINFTEERPDEDIPRLAIDNQVTVDLGNYNAAVTSEHRWSGKVVAPALSTAMGQVCMVINRPIDKKSNILDNVSYTELTAAKIEDMSVEALKAWSSENQLLNITVTKREEKDECKRLCAGLSNMKVSGKIMEKFKGKEHILSQFRDFLLCKDHTKYEKSSLYETLLPSARDQFMPVLRAILYDFQQVPVDFWIDEGLKAHLAILGGVSGGGKSFVSIIALSAYTFMVKIDPDKKKMQAHELALLLKTPDKEPEAGEAPDLGETVETDADAQSQASDEDATSDVEGTTSDAEDATSDVEGTTSDAEGTTSVVEDATPDVENATPDVENATPDVEDATSDTEGTTPDVEGTTPDVEGTTPDVEGTTPDVEDEYEFGRVTHICIQNETVDHSFQTWDKILSDVSTAMDVPKKLIIRLHSIQAERKALVAMLDADFKKTPEDPDRYDHDATLQGKTNEALLDKYLRECRNEYPGITDKRFRFIHGSLAYVVLQLARVKDFKITPEVANTWNEVERDQIATKLRDIANASRDVNTDGGLSDETYKAVKAAFKTAFYIVIERAAVVCTTLSVATKASFQIHRKAHAVALEEAGRGTDLDFTALLSSHWACDVVMLIGDWRQLSSTPYGSELENPFQMQLKLSPFARIHYTGFLMQLLNHSSRFTNPTLLQLCAHLNREPITEVPGSFKTNLEKRAQAINRKIWGKNSVVVVVNTPHAFAMRDQNGSWYSVVTAIATMHDMVTRLRHLDGDNLLVITPYNAQLNLLRVFRDVAVREATAAGNTHLAEQLTNAMMITVDSSMGKDRDHVILDSVGHADGFFWKQPRTLVAGTRARSSFVFIGPTYKYTNSLNGSKDRLKGSLYEWNKAGLIVTADEQVMSRFEQYHDTQVALNLTTGVAIVKTAHRATFGVALASTTDISGASAGDVWGNGADTSAAATPGEWGQGADTFGASAEDGGDGATSSDQFGQGADTFGAPAEDGGDGATSFDQFGQGADTFSAQAEGGGDGAASGGGDGGGE